MATSGDLRDAEYLRQKSARTDSTAKQSAPEDWQVELLETLRDLKDSISASDAKDKRADGEKNMRWAPGRAKTEFTNAFKKEIVDAIRGPLSDGLKDGLKGIFGDAVPELSKLPKELGGKLGETVTNSELLKPLKTAIGDAGGALGKSAGILIDGLKGAKTVGGAMSAVGSAASTMAPALIEVAAAAAPVAAALIAVELAAWAVGPALDGLKEISKATVESVKRDNTSRKKTVDEANKRLLADTHSLIEEPFNILKKSAQEVYQAWDANVRLINATQGYSKADLQGLMSLYASRLRSEGLSKVVSGTDITSNLAKVLQAGLSGKAAEEFAYTATKLNAAIPTQDFFNYASTYSMLASNAISQGKSQAEALKYANEQLELFASGVLYASRQLTGGFNMGLTSASNLLESATKIVSASGRGNASNVAGIFTAISAITGAYAPDLASSLADVIYQSAMGGNSPSIVALRSLAGGNASNTEFLNRLSMNPKSVFVTLFRNLSKMQNMSPSNYMEVAEGLSSVFGISSDAFSRIDFNSLATAISNMDESLSALDENVDLLKSGQTTTTAEQLKMQQINEYLIDEGLAYVLDNEVARSVQEHMWDEQLALQITEAEYGVNLQGAALTFLEGIMHTIDNIMVILNPIKRLEKTLDVARTELEAIAMNTDINNAIKLGVVGTGNETDYRHLTNRGSLFTDLTTSYVELLGGKSMYSSVSSGFKKEKGLVSTKTGADIYYALLSGGFDNIGSAFTGTIFEGLFNGKSEASGIHIPQSSYKWGTVGKSVLGAMRNRTASNLLTSNPLAAADSVATAATANDIAEKFSQFISEDYISKQSSYNAWIASAEKFGISDVVKVAEELGYSESSLKQAWQDTSTRMGVEKQQELADMEQKFWEKGTEFFEKNLKTEETLKTFYDIWVKYYIDRAFYEQQYGIKSVMELQAKERAESSSAVYALADALTQNDMDLNDPNIQTNALLAQILKVVQALMQQNNLQNSDKSLPNSMIGLALGLTK